MLDYYSKKKDMEIGDEHRNVTEWKMFDQTCWMEPRTHFKIHDQQINW